MFICLTNQKYANICFSQLKVQLNLKSIWPSSPELYRVHPICSTYDHPTWPVWTWDDTNPARTILSCVSTLHSLHEQKSVKIHLEHRTIECHSKFKFLIFFLQIWSLSQSAQSALLAQFVKLFKTFNCYWSHPFLAWSHVLKLLTMYPLCPLSTMSPPSPVAHPPASGACYFVRDTHSNCHLCVISIFKHTCHS